MYFSDVVNFCFLPQYKIFVSAKPLYKFTYLGVYLLFGTVQQHIYCGKSQPIYNPSYRRTKISTEKFFSGNCSFEKNQRFSSP